jgi:hypothetical protein
MGIRFVGPKIQKTSKDIGNMGNPVFDTIRKHDCGKSMFNRSIIYKCSMFNSYLVGGEKYESPLG